VFKVNETLGTPSKTLVNDYLLAWLDAFMLDQKAQGVSEVTIHFYEDNFKSFLRFCEI
jgi:hypothetical protein